MSPHVCWHIWNIWQWHINSDVEPRNSANSCCTNTPIQLDVLCNEHQLACTVDVIQMFSTVLQNVTDNKLLNRKHLMNLCVTVDLHSCNLFTPKNCVCVQYNPLLRDIFGLGPPIILDATVKGNKISRFEKVTTGSVSAPVLIVIVIFYLKRFTGVHSAFVSPSASLQLCCFQGPNETEEQSERQASRRHVRGRGGQG